MASVKLNLVTSWQEVSSSSIVISGGSYGTGRTEIINASNLPSGDQEAAFTFPSGPLVSFPAPASGSLYARVSSGTGFLIFYEV